MSCRFLANLYLCSTEIKPPFHGRDNKTQLNNDSLNLFYLVFRFHRLIVIYPESNAWFGTHVNLKYSSVEVSIIEVKKHYTLSVLSCFLTVLPLHEYLP